MRRALPGLALRTTFIVGYPGENEIEFQTLVDFVREIRFDRLGAFQFSFERGTSSEPLGDPVPAEVKQARYDRLMQVQAAISLEMNHSLVGRILDGLIEAVFVPLVEELLKPVGVWLLAGRNLSAAQGFVAGALSGAGYAVFESLALNGGGEDWLSVAIVRSGTAIIHILTTAFSGWALAQAWTHRRYVRLALTYLAVVTVHGLWNGMTLLALFNEITVERGVPILGDGQALRYLSPAILVLLTLVGFAVLIGMNRALKRPKGLAVVE